jgi:hypothetical protein
MDALVIGGGALFVAFLAKGWHTNALLLAALMIVVAFLPYMHSCAYIHV